MTDEQKQKVLLIMAENEGLKRQLRELQGFYDVLSANSGNYARRLDYVKAICDAYFEKRLVHENLVVLQISEAIKP